MTVEIVERLEVVNVDHDHRQAIIVLSCAPILLRQRLIERPPVGEARERILPRQCLQSPICLGQLILDRFSGRDIPQRADDACRLAGLRIVERAQARLNPDPATVLVTYPVDDRKRFRLAAQQGVKYTRDPRRILGMRHAHGLDPNQLLGLEAENFPAAGET